MKTAIIIICIIGMAFFAACAAVSLWDVFMIILKRGKNDE